MTDTDNDQEHLSLNKVFLCPFNQYHKHYDQRKYQFHIARCKDRRGHSIYHCRYVHGHIFTSPEAIKQHESECQQKYDMPASFMENLNDRAPSATYCKYNVDHCFRSLLDREEHESTCPNKQEYERKYQQSQQVYQRLKPELKAMQQKRKEQMVDYTGSHNGPKSREMPHLGYKYVMNEPIIGGEAACYQDSHLQIEFKKRTLYGINSASESPASNLKVQFGFKDQQQNDSANDSKLCIPSKKEEDRALTQANSMYELEERFAEEGIVPPDVNQFTVLQDGEELFGLQVYSRSPQCPLFDMEIEEYVPFSYFFKLTGFYRESCSDQLQQDFEQQYDWHTFLEQHCVMKLNIKRQEDEKYSRTLATQFFDKFCAAMQNADSNMRLTFAINKTRFSATDNCNQQTVLVLISHNSEVVGSLIDSDFAVLQLTTNSINNNSNQNEQHVKELKVCGSAQGRQSMPLQLQQTGQDFGDIDQRMSMALSETNELRQMALVNEKLLRDSERQTRQDKKAVKFLENEVKRVRGEVQDLKNLLDQKELQTKNLKSDLENQNCDLKSLEARFAKQHKAAELCQEQLNKKKVEFDKAMTLLTQANKAIKHKESQLKASEDRVKELEKYVRQVQNIDQGTNPNDQQQQAQAMTTNQDELSFGAIASLPSGSNAQNSNNNLNEEVESKTKSEFVDPALMEDAEILGDENDEEAQETIKLNKIQQKLDQAFLSGQREGAGLCSAECSKKKEHDGKCENQTKPFGESFEQLCIVCQDAPRSVLIQKCRHLVFCERCSLDYALKNHRRKECPICRVEYAKTITVLFC